MCYTERNTKNRKFQKNIFDQPTVFNSVLDSSETVANCIFYLGDCVLVRPLDQNRHALGVLAFLHVSVLGFTLR